MKVKGERKLRGWDPSPTDIERACLDIQARWTDHERRKRAGRSDREGWLPPMMRIREDSVEPEYVW